MKLCIFSGTSEGHELCQFVSQCNKQATVYVATAYGGQVLEPLPGVTVEIGRLSVDEIRRRIDAETLVIDATHPYAVQITKNLRQVCTEQSAEYLRLYRASSDITRQDKNVIFVPDTAAAVEWLNQHDGRVLLTTGSKELAFYTAVADYRTRLYIRVLPTAQVLQRCEALGFSGNRIIAMQGPFSTEMNLALLRRTGAEILVTKDTGAVGGFAEKYQAAQIQNITLLVIARPVEESGYTVEEIKIILCERWRRLHKFPLFVSLEGKRCAVFGAGKIAARRAEILRRFGAIVCVTAPESRSSLQPDNLRPYRSNDLDDIFLAVAATDNRAVNCQIGRDCQARNVFCSVADSAAESSFYFPALCESENFIAGVVSHGENHKGTAKIAEQIRDVLQNQERM